MSGPVRTPLGALGPVVPRLRRSTRRGRATACALAALAIGATTGSKAAAAAGSHGVSVVVELSLGGGLSVSGDRPVADASTAADRLPVGDGSRAPHGVPDTRGLPIVGGPPFPGGLPDVDTLPRVVVLSTGGTIASVYDEDLGGYAPALTGEDLIAAVPGLDQLARVEVEQVANIPSTSMTPEIWVELSQRAREVLASPDVAGVVITHGTDTLEETAYFLDLTVGSDKPVVLVGAQRAASEPDSDGPRNLRDAVRVAVSPDARGMGTVVVMNGGINAAREVTKTHTMNVETFRSLEYGPLGTVDPDAVRFYRAPLRRQTIPVADGARLGRVEIVPNFAGADGRLVRALLDGELPDGLVVQAAGVGNLSEPLFDALEEARRRGIPVVVTSRVPTGRTLPLYAGKGSGVSLKEIGCVFADNLSAQKARVLLLAALTHTRDPRELQAIFAR